MLAKEKEIARLSALVKKYDDLIAYEEKLSKLQRKNNAAGIGGDMVVKSGIVSQHRSKFVESTESMAQRLQKCELLHNLTFANEKIEHLSSSLYRYEATGLTGPVEFHISFVVDEPNNDDDDDDDEDEAVSKRTVKSIDIDFRDPFHKSELSLWLPNCLRHNDLQMILRCIPTYGELFAMRNKVTTWLEYNYSQFFTVDIRTEIGGILISAHSAHQESYFDAEWKICKDPIHQSVCNSLFFSVYDSFGKPDLLGKCEDAFKILVDNSKPTIDLLMTNWQIIANAVSGNSM